MDEGEISSYSRSVRADHDLQLSGLVVRFVRVGGFERGRWDARGWKPDSPVGRESFIDLSGNPFHVLLGRNGSGKSLLLSAVGRVSSSDVGFPSVSALFSIPAQDEFEGWEGVVVRTKGADWFTSYAEEQSFNTPTEEMTLEDVVGLPIASAVCRLLRSVLRPEADVPLEQLGERLLSLGVEDVPATLAREESWRGDDEFLELSGCYPPVLMMREASPRMYAAEYLRYMSTRLHANDSGAVAFSEYPGYRLAPMGHWYAAGRLSPTVYGATKEFFDSLSHVEWMGGNQIRLLAPAPEPGPLREYLDQTEREANDIERENDARRRPEVIAYSLDTFARAPMPHGLFRRESVGGAAFVVSAEMDLPAAGGAAKSLGLVMTRDISPTHDALERAMEVLWERLMLEDAVQVTDGESAVTITASLHIPDGVSGLLERVSSSVARCGIGVSAVRCGLGLGIDNLDWVNPDNRLEAIRAGKSLMQFAAESEAGHALTPVLEWCDERTGEWHHFDRASLGQQQTVLMMLMLHHLRDGRNGMHTIVVSDEFDRHLHPEASKLLMAEVQKLVSGETGFTLLCSTHSVPQLGSPELSSVRRIYAQRGLEAFEYVNSGEIGLEEMQDILGASALDALRTKRLHILVEGLHDRMIIGELLRDQVPEVPDINIVMGNGVNSWAAIIENTLRFMDAQILMVYDKRNEELEDAWTGLVHQLRTTGVAPSWQNSGLSKINAELNARRLHKATGDLELEEVLRILRKTVLVGDKALAKRVSLFGIEQADIVDCLPISEFPKAAIHGSWENAQQAFKDEVKKKFRSGGGRSFKDYAGVDEKSVRRAMSRAGDFVHPELGRLIEHVRALLAGG